MAGARCMCIDQFGVTWSASTLKLRSCNTLLSSPARVHDLVVGAGLLSGESSQTYQRSAPSSSSSFQGLPDVPTTGSRCRAFRSLHERLEPSLTRFSKGSFLRLAGKHHAGQLRAQQDSSPSLEASLSELADLTGSDLSPADSIAESLGRVEVGVGIDARFANRRWDNLAPQGAKARLVDKALTRLMRESDESKALAYLDHWEGSLDPKCVLQLIQEMGERKALTKVLPVLEWCRKQQWTRQELCSAYCTVIQAAEALAKADAVVHLFDQMQETDHLTPDPDMYPSLAHALIKTGSFEKAYETILKLVELGQDVGEGEASILGALFFRASISPGGGTVAVGILRRALGDGLVVDTRMVTSTLIGLQKEVPKGLAEVTKAVTDEVKAKGIKLDQFAYRVMLTTYQRTDALSLLRDALHEMEEGGLEMNMDSYRYLIPKLSAEERAEEAYAETRRLQSKGAFVEGWIFRSCMYACCRAGLCDQAAHLYQDSRKAGFEPTQTQLNYLMGAFAKAGRKAEVLALYEEMLAANLQPSAVTYGTLMDLERPNLARVRAWYDMMRQEGVEPDRAVYHILIDTLAVNGEVDAAFPLLDELEKALRGVGGGLRATPYIALASGLAAADRLNEAVDVLLRMKAKRMVVTTQSLVDVFKAASQKSGATVSMLLQVAEQKGLPLTPSALTEIASLFRRQRAVGAAWEVAKKLKAQEPTLYRRSFVEILNIHSRKGEWVDAQVTFDKMVRAGIKPQANDWSSLLAAYGKGVEYDKAVAVFQQMVASGERPDTSKYNILIDACIRADRPGEVTRWLAEMKERRVPFDAITFNMVIGAYAGKGDVRATEFTYRKMLENGHTPGKETYHYLIRASIAGGQLEAAPAWLEEMRKRGIERDVFTYNTLIRGYTQRRRVEELEVVVGDMLAGQVPPDHITYELLFDFPGEGDRLARVLFASVKRFMDPPGVEGQYNRLLMALLRCSRWSEVELVVDQAYEEARQLDKRTFESAIEKMAAAKKITMAINMFHRMRAAMPHAVPREFAFMPVLHSYGRRRQWKQAAELLGQLKDAGVPCRAATHHKVLSIMEASQQWEAIAELYESVRDETFAKSDKGILHLVMRAGQALAYQKHPSGQTLAEEAYQALRALRYSPNRPQKVDSQKVQAGRLWKRGMGITRGAGLRKESGRSTGEDTSDGDSDGDDVRQSPSVRDGSTDRESSGDEASGSDSEEYGTEGASDGDSEIPAAETGAGRLSANESGSSEVKLIDVGARNGDAGDTTEFASRSAQSEREPDDSFVEENLASVRNGSNSKVGQSPPLAAASGSERSVPGPYNPGSTNERHESPASNGSSSHPLFSNLGNERDTNFEKNETDALGIHEPP